MMMKEFKDSMMNEFDMSDLGKMTYFLGIEMNRDEDGKVVNSSYYKQLIGRLMYLKTTRLDIIPTELHLSTTKCLLRYLSDLGKMTYFLGIEVIQYDEGIFISQRKHVNEILRRFGMEDYNAFQNHIVPGI
ncbi:hypothetical protein V2J09_018091 [Rumex salicifolius]